jgi:hypothetical protein
MKERGGFQSARFIQKLRTPPNGQFRKELKCYRRCAKIEKAMIMADRMSRLAQFINDHMPPDDEAVQLLCEDHSGTYTLPFLCRWVENSWINTETSLPIDAEVLGWRKAPLPSWRRSLA